MSRDMVPPQVQALVNVPPHSYHPVHQFVRSLLVSCEKGEVMSNIEACELLVK